MKDRYQRLVAVADEVAWTENKRQVGRRLDVMVAEGEGRKDAATHRLSGRAPDNRLVHFTAPDAEVRPGDVATVEVTYAAPHHLVADGPVAVRRTRVGDAWEARHGRRSPQASARHADRRRSGAAATECADRRRRGLDRWSTPALAVAEPRRLITGAARLRSAPCRGDRVRPHAG